MVTIRQSVSAKMEDTDSVTDSDIDSDIDSDTDSDSESDTDSDTAPILTGIRTRYPLMR